jgi:hypothetical protein
MLQKYRLTTFNIVCVDEQKSLPHIVDRVPLILAPGGDIIVDDAIMTYLSEMYNKSNGLIGALMTDNGEAFSFIDEKEETDNHVQRPFDFLENLTLDFQADAAPDFQKVTNMDTKDRGNSIAVSLERYTQERDKDLKDLTNPGRYN